MRRREQAPRALSARLLVIGVAVAAMLGAIVAVERLTQRAPASAEQLDAFIALPQEPIAYEADVFRIRAVTVADVRRRTSAHPRSLATYRRLRAFPGAPPRVPHGLTSAELRAPTCNTCHERGGYSQRFGAYAPLTPHPDLPACLQCHVVDAVVAGAAIPTGALDDDRCRQCHAPGRQSSSAPALDWQSAPWPQVRRPAIEGDPPPIPHHLEFRGNCLACHVGPNAVAEIRTTHPERTNCRQCHVRLDDAVPEYVRPAVAVRAGSGGAP